MSTLPISILLLGLVVSMNPCSRDDFASWRMADLSRAQASDEYDAANQAFARGETAIALGTRDHGDALMDDADGYWAQIPAACQTFLIGRGDDGQ